MKTRTVVMIMLVLTVVAGAVADAPVPSPNLYFNSPDGGSITIQANPWGTMISMGDNKQRSAQMIMTNAQGPGFPAVTYITANEGFAVSRLVVGQGVGKVEVSNAQGQFSALTPDGLWIGGVRRF